MRDRRGALAGLLAGALLAAGGPAAQADTVLAAGQQAAAADDGARVVGERWLDRRTADLTVSSPAVGRSVPVRILVPPGWSATAKRTWPVLYLLHGTRDDYRSWTRSTDIERLSAKTGVLIVMPDAGWGGYYTDWWNYGRGGAPRYETFHLTELKQILERRYRAGKKRAVAGLSAGGEGALSYAGRHPGMFRYAASYSGYVATEILGVPTLFLANAALLGVDPLAMWGLPHSSYWQAHDPLYLAPKLKGTGLYLASGTTGLAGPLDKPDAQWTATEPIAWATTVELAKKLKELHIPVTTNIYQDGTHSWPYWKRELHSSWPLILRSLGLRK